MADWRADKPDSASESLSDSAFASADGREDKGVSAITTCTNESDSSDDDVYEDRDDVIRAKQLANPSVYLSPLSSTIKSGGNHSECTNSQQSDSGEIGGRTLGTQHTQSRLQGTETHPEPNFSTSVRSMEDIHINRSSNRDVQFCPSNFSRPTSGPYGTLNDPQLYENFSSDGVYELLPGDLEGGNKKKKKGVKALFKKLFSKNRKGKRRDPPPLAYVAACNKEVATVSDATEVHGSGEGDFPVFRGRGEISETPDYYNICSGIPTPEDGDPTDYKDVPVTSDSIPRKGGCIRSPSESVIPSYSSEEDGKGMSDSPEYHSYASLPGYGSCISDRQGSNGVELCGDALQRKHGRQTDGLQTTLPASPINVEYQRSVQKTTKSEGSSEEAELRVKNEVRVVGLFEEENAEPERLGSLENILYNAKVVSSSAVASSCALESVVIPLQFLEVASVKEKCIESFEKISSYHRLLEDIKEVHPVHGVLGPFVDYRNPSVVEAYQACLETMDEVTKWICENHEEFAGDLIGTGSFHDGTKIGRANEFDFLFQLRNTSFRMQLDSQKNLTFKVMSDCVHDGAFSEMCKKVHGKCYLISERFYRTFAGHVNAALKTIELPSKMRHAGFCSPRFSGVRKCGPAATIPIYFQHRGGEEVLITIDISPALPVSFVDIQQAANIQWPLSMLDQLNENETAQIHLIPGDRSLLWRLSTAKLEVNYMAKKFAGDGKVRRTIQIVKSLLEKHLTVRIEVTEREKAKRKLGMIRFAEKYLNEGTLLKHVQHLARQKKLREMLLLHQACLGIHKSSVRVDITREMESMEAILREEMLNGWGTVDPITLSLSNEMTPACVSTKSCVVKYTVLDLFFNGFLTDDDHSSPSLFLIHKVMQTSTNEEVTHSLLRTDIRTKNISAYAERSVPNMSNADWIELHNDLCSKLLDKIQDLNDKRSIAGDKHRDIPVPVMANSHAYGMPRAERQQSQLTADYTDSAISVTHSRSSGSCSFYADRVFNERHMMYQHANLSAQSPLSRHASVHIPEFRDNCQPQPVGQRETLGCSSCHVNPRRTARPHSTCLACPVRCEIHTAVPTISGYGGGAVNMHDLWSPHCTCQATSICQSHHCCQFCRGVALGQSLSAMTQHGGINGGHSGCCCHRRSASVLNVCPAPSMDYRCHRNPSGIVVPEVSHPAGTAATAFPEDYSQTFTPEHLQQHLNGTQISSASRRQHLVPGEIETPTPYPPSAIFPETRGATPGGDTVFYPPRRHGYETAPRTTYWRTNDPYQEDLTERLAVPPPNVFHRSMEYLPPHSTNYMAGTRGAPRRVRSNISLSGAMPQTHNTRQASFGSQGLNVMAL